MSCVEGKRKGKRCEGRCKEARPSGGLSDVLAELKGQKRVKKANIQQIQCAVLTWDSARQMVDKRD